MEPILQVGRSQWMNMAVKSALWQK